MKFLGLTLIIMGMVAVIIEPWVALILMTSGLFVTWSAE